MDLSKDPSLVTTVAALRESTDSLCSSISLRISHCLACGTPNIDANDRLLLRPLRALNTELRLFSGAIYSLEKLVQQFDLANVAPTPLHQLLLLRQSSLLIRTLGNDFHHLSPNSLRDYREKTRISRRRVAYIIAQSHTLQDCLLFLSTLGEENDCRMGVDLDRLSSWLEILNSPHHNRQPSDYHLEQRLLEDRRSEFPDYSTAATQWILYAEQYWSAVSSRIEDLFATPTTFNFVQWALEFSRESWPSQLGLGCADPSAIIDLTEALCNGSSTPLHLAAAIGLPSLCQSLISKASSDDLHQDGRLGTPLYCALAGPKVLVVGNSPPSWQSILSDNLEVKSRRTTIAQLLAAESDYSYRFQWANDDDGASLAGLAFWAAFVLDDFSIFERILAGGAIMDDSFSELLSLPALATDTVARTDTLALLLTCAFDSTFKCDDEYPWYREDSVLAKITDLMRQHQLSFADGLGRRKNLLHVSDGAFPPLVLAAIVDDELSYLRRLSMDSRFDANLTAGQYEDNGTIAHLAVGGDHIEAVDLLVAMGADFTATDRHGRSPLLLSESVPMLSRLVHHGISTTQTDSKGRNIWHYAAATNDGILLDWLCSNDPSREQNMAARMCSGATPLDKALNYINRLRGIAKGHARSPEPVAARVILAAGAASVPSSSSIPLFHLAVSWGASDLVDGLLAAGADPRMLDKRGRTAAHFLNLGAPPALISRIQHLCRGLHVGSDDGLTPADTILVNTVFFYTGAISVPSEHPSCRGVLSEKMYNSLLTPQTLAYRDSSGRKAWARFCQRVLPHFDQLANRGGGGKDISFYTSSLATASRCLIRCGAAAEYERETGRAAVSCLAIERAGRLCWEPSRLPLLREILDNYSSPLTELFLGCEQGSSLLSSAEAARDGYLLQILGRNGLGRVLDA